MNESNSNQESALGMLAYVPGGFLIVWMQKGKDAFYKTHAKQGAVLTGIFLLMMVLGVLIAPLMGLLMAVWVVISTTGAVQAYQGKSFTLPFLSDWANKMPLEKMDPVPTAEAAPAPVAPVQAPVAPVVEPAPMVMPSEPAIAAAPSLTPEPTQNLPQ
jgi:uncharacterized membrane protein